MHPGNSGLSGGAFFYDKHVTSIKKERQEEIKKKGKRRKNGRLPCLLFYIDFLCIRECNARLCAMPFIIYT